MAVACGYVFFSWRFRNWADKVIVPPVQLLHQPAPKMVSCFFVGVLWWMKLLVLRADTLTRWSRCLFEWPCFTFKNPTLQTLIDEEHQYRITMPLRKDLGSKWLRNATRAFTNRGKLYGTTIKLVSGDAGDFLLGPCAKLPRVMNDDVDVSIVYRVAFLLLTCMRSLKRACFSVAQES